MRLPLILMLLVTPKGERLLGDSFLEPAERRTPFNVSCCAKQYLGGTRHRKIFKVSRFGPLREDPETCRYIQA